MSNLHQAGRPDKIAQLQMRLEILECFHDRVKPVKAVEETGHNIKTVRKIYRELTNKVIENREEEFFKNGRISNERTITQMNIIIEKLEKSSGILETKIKLLGHNLLPENQWIYDQYRRTQETISKLLKEVNTLENSPTADLTLRKNINDILKKQSDLGV